ncbi:hypothetical protein [Streptomyces sp. SAI-144]|uniref:hypothetical protein n=1 Tax=Streptomyces sp. SAI-144 TaxID=2940544 RepID=UPI00247330AF|nr:hypothetical protein [Streptomyces sp. SAI-144]
MADTYTTLWTNDLCRALGAGGFEGEPLTVLFGGPHTSMPSFARAGVRPGDRILPIRVFQKQMWVLGTMEVERLVDYDRVGEELSVERQAHLNRWGMLEGSCASEVLLGGPGVPLGFGRPVPPDLLARLTYRSRRGERQIKHVVEGELRSAVSLQGVYRLAPDSARELEEFLGSTAARA